MIRSLLIVLFVLITAQAEAETLRTTVRTTTTLSDKDITSATLSQLLQTMLSFDNQSMRFKGEIFSAWDDNFIFFTDEGKKLRISLDDGCTTRKKAQNCPDMDASTGCTAELTIDLKVTVNEYLGGSVHIDGVGYDVTFLK